MPKKKMSAKELLADAESPKMMKDTTKKVLAYVRECLRLEEELAEETENAKATAAKIREIKEKRIPGLMNDVGLTKVVIEDKGDKFQVTVKTGVYPSVSQERMPKVCDWLEEHDRGGAVKNELTVDLGRESQEELKRILQALKKVTNRPMDVRRTVHAGTLKAILREMVEAHEDVPLNLFNAQIIDTANIKPVRR